MGQRRGSVRLNIAPRTHFGGYGLPEEAGIIFDADGCRVLNPILEKKADEMAASERQTLMYAIKTIHDPFSNTQ
jgi:hypothetical protein